MQEECQTARMKFIEKAVEVDDEVMELYLSGAEISEADLNKCIRKGTIGATFVPVLCGSAFKNKGIQPMLDAVINTFLCPKTEIPPVKCVDEEEKSGQSVLHLLMCHFQCLPSKS